MGNFIRRHLFPVSLLALVAVVLLTVMVVRQIGNAYRAGLSQYETKDAGGPKQLVKTRNIAKVTVRKSGQPQCIEVTPDGKVRVYDTCGGELTDTYRSTDTGSVQRLFMNLGAKSYATTPVPDALEVRIELDDGTVTTVYIPSGSASGTPESNIIGAVDDIISQQPQPTVTPPPGATPTPVPTIPPGITVTPTIYNPFATPTPTPAPGVLKPFTCDFNDTSTGTKKPYRVSNVVCSTEPQPAQ